MTQVVWAAYARRPGIGLEVAACVNVFKVYGEALKLNLFIYPSVKEDKRLPQNSDGFRSLASKFRVSL